MLKKLFGALILSIVAFSHAGGQDIPKWKISDLTAYIQKSNKPTVVNFWATYCKPCIGEIPHFQKLVKKYGKDSVQLLLVSLDMEEAYPAVIQKFAEKLKIAAPIVYLDETNADVFCPQVDEKWSGAIPATLFINNKTGYRKFYEKELPEQKFESELKSLLAGNGNKKSDLITVILLVTFCGIILFVLYRNRQTARSSH